jgi:hypothetical protein
MTKGPNDQNAVGADLFGLRALKTVSSFEFRISNLPPHLTRSFRFCTSSESRFMAVT